MLDASLLEGFFQFITDHDAIGQVSIHPYRAPRDRVGAADTLLARGAVELGEAMRRAG